MKIWEEDKYTKEEKFQTTRVGEREPSHVGERERSFAEKERSEDC